MVERINTDLMALCEHVTAHATVQSETNDAQEASSGFEARWKSDHEHAKGTE